MRLAVFAFPLVVACDSADNMPLNDEIAIACEEEDFYLDADRDGYGSIYAETVRMCPEEAPEWLVQSSSDCDDLDPGVYPDAAEVCDGKDNNCNDQADEDQLTLYFPDYDGDGFANRDFSVHACGPPSSYYIEASGKDLWDCNDMDATQYPDTNSLCALGSTCLDILDAGLSTGDGRYIIDPDGHSYGLDPFYVECDMTTDDGGWTQIAYKTNLKYGSHFTGGDAWRYLPSDFTFELSDAQITAIQALSTEGHQEYVGECNDVMHYLSMNGTHNVAFGFMFFDGTQTPYGQASYAPHNISVIRDECSSNNAGTTVFVFDSVLVPVRNVMCFDCGGNNGYPERFGSKLTKKPAWLR